MYSVYLLWLPAPTACSLLLEKPLFYLLFFGVEEARLASDFHKRKDSQDHNTDCDEGVYLGVVFLYNERGITFVVQLKEGLLSPFHLS